jgi:enterochelin esterase-like enzyme
VAFLGWSMGGFGALLLGRELGPARVAAVGAVSAAVWTSAGATAPGAFDDAEDYHRHDLFTRPDAWRGIAVRLDCGLQDPFVAGNRALARRIRPAPATGFGPGGHTTAYWRATAPAQLRAVGAALAG